MTSAQAPLLEPPVMKLFDLPCVASLAPVLVSMLWVAPASAQRAAPAPLAPAADIKTAPEPNRPVQPEIERASPAQSAPVGAPKQPESPDRAAPRIDWSRVFYDAPGDGNVWARGQQYKASFGPAGATYFPLFGAQQPRHVPHALSPDSVTIGGEAIAFERSVAATRGGDRITLDRGAFTEVYDMGPQSIEQSFVFDALPRGGEIVLRIPVASELEGRENASGLEFTSDLGRMTYSRAVAIDAAGHQVQADTRLIDGAIVLHVGADFVAQATFPLVIDPVVQTYSFQLGGYQDSAADVSWDPTSNRWLIVYEEVATATDHDVLMQLVTINNTLLNFDWIDITSDSWTGPRCANMRTASQFLVVAGVESFGTRLIRSRTVGASPYQPGGQITVTGADFGDKIHPDVGGDPYLGLAYYCVVYERVLNPTDTDIHAKMVGTNGIPLAGPTILLSNSGPTLDALPAISNSNDQDDWMITWERHDTPANGNSNIWAGRINWDGTIAQSPFQITSGGNNEWVSSVSSPLTGTHKYLIAYQKLFGNHHDIYVTLVDNATILQDHDLSAFENFNAQLDQIDPSVDSDGNHFLVTYSENFLVVTSSDYDVYCSELYVQDGLLGLAQTHQNLAFSGSAERRNRCVSLAATGETDAAFKQRYVLAWTDSWDGGDIEGAVFDGQIGGPKTPYCFGDGTGTACPCGNASAVGAEAGCLNAQGLAARLVATGAASSNADSVTLTATGLPNGSPSTFFQGTTMTNGGSGGVFGDGLRCASGSVVRLYRAPAVAGSLSIGSGVAGTPLLTSAGGIPATGATRYYQVSYRNAAAFCSPATFNLTNGVAIAWAP